MTPTMRQHQVQFEAAIQEIIDGAPITDILVKATPGSGKSSLPIIAGRLITAGLADGICWVCPRQSLQDQAERNFLDPFFRDLFSHGLTIRSSTNEFNPRRGTSGFVTTYQAIGVDENRTVLNEIRQRRYILVLDEYHHAEAEDGSWTKALEPIYRAAAYRVLMTGTLERGDGKRIAFTRYDGMMPVLEHDETTRVVEYTRRDALADRAIIPLEFMFTDGVAEWERASGSTVKSKLSTHDPRRASHALYTALRTEYALELLSDATAHWQKHRLEVNPSASLLVVTANISTARKYTAWLAERGHRAAIATSDDSADATARIKAFRRGEIDMLVTCQMAYEGLDCPSISHIACLTNIRSAPWIEQMVARAVRIDPRGGPYESQRGHIFAPDDLYFREITEKIEADQLVPAFAVKNGNGNGAGRPGKNGELFEGEERAPQGIRPLSSQVIGRRQEALGGMSASQFHEMTVSEQEEDLLKQIEAHIRRYSFNNRMSPKRLNAEIYDHQRKSRRDMTLTELQKCLEWVRAAYPITYIRGTGRARVPTRAMPFPVAWRQ